MCLKYCCMNGKPCRPLSDTAFCGFWSGTTLFVCVEVLWPSQSNGVMSSPVSVPNHTFTWQAQFSKPLTSIVHILSTADNCPSWISRRETTALLESAGENDHRKYFRINPHERMLPTRRGPNSKPPDHQLDTHPSLALHCWQRLICPNT